MFSASLGSAIRTALLFVGLAALALLAGTVIAFAQSWVSLSGTVVELGPSSQPGAVGEVTMRNISNNGSHDNGDYPLTMGDIGVTVTFTWNSGGTSPDTMAVDAGPDHIAVPPLLDVDEDTTGRIVIYPLRAVGM